MKLFLSAFVAASALAGAAFADCRVGDEICVAGGVQRCTVISGNTTGYILKNPYQSCTVNAPQIAGTWRLFHADAPNGPVSAVMQISQGPGANIQASGAGWSGSGKLNGANGYYDWRFTDGDSGRTTFHVNGDGTLSGTVAGGRAYTRWSFVARH